jgi:hypothetical protein
MHSEPIASHHRDLNEPKSRASALRSKAFGIAVIGVAILALAGCAEGTSRDAERGREADAERTSVVDSLQATSSADLVRRAGEATPPLGDAAATESAADAEGD